MEKFEFKITLDCVNQLESIKKRLLNINDVRKVRLDDAIDCIRDCESQLIAYIEESPCE